MPGADRSRLLALVDALSGRRVAIVGDLIADEFIYGRIARVSREAPVLILNYDSTEIVPGGAGNAAANVAALGGAARAIGLVGRDEAGRRLIATLNRWRVDARGFLLAGFTPQSSRSFVSIECRHQHRLTGCVRASRRECWRRFAGARACWCRTTAAVS
jgi:sugar/nucleoside kinase (ribokinase family)